jgi:hypothetical protein
MADTYSAVVRAVVVEADRRAAEERRERVNRGVALAQLLAKTADLHYKAKSIQSWMRGDTTPPANVLLAVAHSTGISLDDRLGVGREPTAVEQRLAEVQEELAQQRSATVAMEQRLEEFAARLEGRELSGAAPGSPTSLEDLEKAIRRLEDEMAEVGAQLHRRWDGPAGISYRRAFAGQPERLVDQIGTLQAHMAEVASMVGAPYGGYLPTPESPANEEAVRAWLVPTVATLERQMLVVRERAHEIEERPSTGTGDVGEGRG